MPRSVARVYIWKNLQLVGITSLCLFASEARDEKYQPAFSFCLSVASSFFFKGVTHALTFQFPGVGGIRRPRVEAGLPGQSPTS